MPLDYFIIKYFETEEHYYSDADEWLNDKFYSEAAYIAKAQELMFNKLYYRVEVYAYTNKLQPIRLFLFSKFNRKKYYKQNQHGKQ